jgi:hypothetical protein
MAPNPFSENRMENASSYQMGREEIPSNRVPKASSRMARGVRLKNLSDIIVVKGFCAENLSLGCPDL